MSCQGRAAASPLDPKIWRACAGVPVEIPMPHSRVYYFPQGHFDQAISPPRNLSPSVLVKPCVLCRVVSVEFLADPLTDEVFAKQSLQPIINYQLNHNVVAPSTVVPPHQNDADRIHSFSKVLTPSDANNGGGFSVPRSCAESIFPPLNFLVDPPVQNLTVTDVHGFVWVFRHIFRGTPRRHLLTSGWSKFVNAKKLVAGDSVVFMKNSAGQLFVGIRRATRFADVGCLRNMVVDEENNDADEEDKQGKEVFSRDGKGKLSATAVAAEAELAAQNMPFEVVYYPKACWSEFVVKTEAVDEAMRVLWRQGLRVKRAMETDDSSTRITWFQGTVSSVNFNENDPWRGSPWRMLQITWDEPEVFQNANWISPWQVELISNAPAFHSVFSPTKKFRGAHGSEMFTDGDGNSFSMEGFTNSATGNLNQALLSYGPCPASMQGARHDVFSASSFSNYPSDMGMKTTELHVGCSQSDELLPDSRSSLNSCGTELVRNIPNCNSRNPDSTAFQLFGVQIEPVEDENGSHDTDNTGDDDDQLRRASAVKAK